MKSCVLLTPSLNGGGAERVFVDIAKALSRVGIEVHVVCVQSSGILASELDGYARVHDLGAPRLACSFFKIRKIVKLLAPDVVLSTMTHTNVTALIGLRVFSRYKGKMLVQEVALLGRGRTKRDSIVLFAAKLLYRQADAIIAVSEAIRDELLYYLRVPDGKLVVVPNPVDLSRIKELSTHRALHPWVGNNALRLVVAVGRLSKEKGYENLIKAFALAAKQDISLRLLIIGDGPECQNLQATISENNLSHVCSLLGYVENPYALMAKADLFVLSSVSEGFSLATVEALACGTNVVVTDCGSEPREIVDNGRLGRIVPINDPDSLAMAISSAHHLRMDIEQVDAHIKKYDIKVVCGEYLRLLSL